MHFWIKPRCEVDIHSCEEKKKIKEAVGKQTKIKWNGYKEPVQETLFDSEDENSQN